MATPSYSDRPLLIFAPYLPVRQAVEVGPWWIRPLAEYSGGSLSDNFEDVSRRLIGSYAALLVAFAP